MPTPYANPHPDEVLAWRQRLTDPRARIRRRAVRALAKAEVWGAVRAAADDPDVEVRRLAARELGRTCASYSGPWARNWGSDREHLRAYDPDPAATLALLVRLAADPSPAVRANAVMSLGRASAPNETAQALRAATVAAGLRDPVPEVVTAAKGALIRLERWTHLKRPDKGPGVHVGVPRRKRRPSGKRAPPRRSRGAAAARIWEPFERQAHDLGDASLPWADRHRYEEPFRGHLGEIGERRPYRWQDAASPVGRAVARLVQRGREQSGRFTVGDAFPLERREALLARVTASSAGPEALPDHPSVTRLRVALVAGEPSPRLSTLAELGAAAGLVRPLQPDWDALSLDLARTLPAPCALDPLGIELTVAGFEAFVRGAPPTAVARLDAIAAGVHDDWVELWLLPDAPPRRTGLGLGVDGLPQPDLSLLEAVGRRGRAGRPPVAARALAVLGRDVGVDVVLTAGAGVLESMDYPSFELVTRRATVGLDPDLAYELDGIIHRLREIDRARRSSVQEVLRHAYPGWEYCTDEALAPAAVPQLERDAAAYVRLRASGILPMGTRIRRSHLRRFWTRADAPSVAPAEILREADPDLARQGLALAALVAAREPYPASSWDGCPAKEVLVQLARVMVSTVGHDWSGEAPEERPADLLHRQFSVVPTEVAEALGLDPRQGFPLLHGGKLPELEHRWSKVVHKVALARAGSVLAETPRRFDCRPITKLAALGRGTLGADCSSGSVPLRCLSPHHVYYGIFHGALQLRGYMTVFEAWAERDDGSRLPVLCLETINVPLPVFDAVQYDLLLLFSAIAEGRGLAGLVLVGQCNTWNYANYHVLARARRCRNGEQVTLRPADPAWWSLHASYDPSWSIYQPFLGGYHTLLGPDEPGRASPTRRSQAPDPVQPENVVEAARLRALPRRPLLATSLREGAVTGFISALPRQDPADVAVARCVAHVLCGAKAERDAVVAGFVAELAAAAPLERAARIARLEELAAVGGLQREAAVGLLEG